MTLEELMNKFASDDSADTGAEPVVEENAVIDGTTKLASGGEGMNSLQDIYLSMAEVDMHKTAAQAADVGGVAEGEVDFAKMAADLAGAEADSLVKEASDDQEGIIKIAAEYDAAGRIMARGFYDEFHKLAGALDTDVTPNQTTESASSASTPALGDRGLPTVETNFAGNEAHDGKIETAQSTVNPKQVYADSLKPKKTISAGQGTGDDPEASAVSVGGGSPAGFATVRDLAGGTTA